MKKLFSLFVFCLLLSSLGYAWQQRVAYDIDVKLDTVKHYLHGTEHLRYWNNSPDTLRSVWFHLYPNAYRNNNTSLAKDADRYHDYRGYYLEAKDRGSIKVDGIQVDNHGMLLEGKNEYSPLLKINNPGFTQMLYDGFDGGDSDEVKVNLPRTLRSNDSIDFTISFNVQIPKIISRLGHTKTHYEISQWYPKIVVYDEKGWHPDGYHYLGEFYGDYGSFNVGITTPKGMQIGATGVEIADTTDTTQQASDSTDYHLFCAEDVHDFAWCADAKYVVTGEMHNGVLIKVMTLLRDTVKWQHVMQYAKDALDYYGKWYGAYPYSALTVCDGSMAAGGGMEYPNLVIISSGEDKITRTLEIDVVHEIGHQWFYGMLGNNEMDEAWLDEGINSFSEQRYLEEKYGGRGNFFAKPFLQKLLPEFTDRYFGDIFNYVFAASRMEQPVLTKACAVREPALYADIAYYKPARMMWWLKDYLGNAMFDRVMRAYFTRYQFRHVNTEAFFGVVDSVAKKDIRPFFMPMLTTTRRCEYAIGSIKPVALQNNMYQIRLQRRDSLVLPVSLRLDDLINKRYAVNWSGKGTDTTFYVQTDAKLHSVELDPDHALPETERFNDHWPRQWSLTMLPRLPSPDKYQIFCLPVPWYDGINGFRFGPYIHGGYMLDGGPMVGRHQWTFAPYWGFKSRQLSFSADYQTPVSSLPMPPRVYVSLGKAFDAGWARLGLRRAWGQALMAPDQRFDLRLSYDRVIDTARFWDGRDIDKGECWIAAAERGIVHTGWQLGSNLRVAAAAGLSNTPGNGMRNFMRTEAEERAYLRFNTYMRLDLRGIIGQVSGDAPAQEQYFLSGGFKTTGFTDLIISYKGWWSAQERYHVEGGADLPGYAGRHIRGNKVAALTLSFPIYRTPVNLFAGAGQILNDWTHFNPNHTMTNAGLDLRLSGVRLLLPLWINQPEAGKKRFGWRWQISIGGSFTIG